MPEGEPLEASPSAGSLLLSGTSANVRAANARTDEATTLKHPVVGGEHVRQLFHRVAAGSCNQESCAPLALPGKTERASEGSETRTAQRTTERFGEANSFCAIANMNTSKSPH